MLDIQCGAVAPRHPTRAHTHTHTHACYSVSDNTLLAITKSSHQHLARDPPNNNELTFLHNHMMNGMEFTYVYEAGL